MVAINVKEYETTRIAFFDDDRYDEIHISRDKLEEFKRIRREYQEMQHELRQQMDNQLEG